MPWQGDHEGSPRQQGSSVRCWVFWVRNSKTPRIHNGYIIVILYWSYNGDVLQKPLISWSNYGTISPTQTMGFNKFRSSRSGVPGSACLSPEGWDIWGRGLGCGRSRLDLCYRWSIVTLSRRYVRAKVMNIDDPKVTALQRWLVDIFWTDSARSRQPGTALLDSDHVSLRDPCLFIALRWPNCVYRHSAFFLPTWQPVVNDPDTYIYIIIYIWLVFKSHIQLGRIQ
jgi:hypothetical protein